MVRVYWGNTLPSLMLSRIFPFPWGNRHANVFHLPNTKFAYCCCYLCFSLFVGANANFLFVVAYSSYCDFYFYYFSFISEYFFLGIFSVVVGATFGAAFSKVFALHMARKCRECWSFSSSPHQTPYSSHAAGI